VFAIQNTVEAFNNGTHIVMLDAPTGSGKTLIGEMVRQTLGCRALYLCSSIQLQDQFCHDFPDAALLKGRANYPTADRPEDRNLNAGDCVKERLSIKDFPACYGCDPCYLPMRDPEPHCRWCHPVLACPYEQAKFSAMQSDLVCTNTAYFLHEANYVGTLPLGRKLIIIDEADTLEDVLMGFVEVSITHRRAKEFGIEPPDKKTVESSWVEWAAKARQHLASVHVDGDSIQLIRKRNYLNRLRADIARLCDGDTGLSSGGWVYTGYAEGHIQFKPVTIAHVAGDFLWRHCDRFLLMSATTISFEAMAQHLGFDN
jgi:Rad3-related DNA helicase